MQCVILCAKMENIFFLVTDVNSRLQFSSGLREVLVQSISSKDQKKNEKEIFMILLYFTLLFKFPKFCYKPILQKHDILDTEACSDDVDLINSSKA